LASTEFTAIAVA